MRVYIELKRGEVPEVVLNNLYKQTELQCTFGMNMVALVDGQPRLLNLKQILECFLRHRREVVTRRTVYELKKARERGHILEGLAVALSNVDEVIGLIKASATPPEAKLALMAREWHSPLVQEMLARVASDSARPEWLSPEFGLKANGYKLSEAQAQAILDMRLQRLTGLEQDKLVAEYKDVMDKIVDLLDILSKPERVTQIISDEMEATKLQFGDARRSEIIQHGEDISLEDLITPQDMVVTLSHSGYFKAQPLEDYRSQRRGGRGKQAAATKEDDFIDNLFIANTHDYVLCFSSLGRVYWMKVYEVPQGGRTSRGKPIVNLLPLADGEKINAILPIKEFADDHYVFFCTSLGTVKKTPLSDFSRPMKRGIIAVDLDEGDYLIGVAITDGQSQIMLCSDEGKAVRFDEDEVRAMGRGARGVRGMRLGEGAQVISLMVVASDELFVLTATENGYGKRTLVSEYRHSGRGTQGVIAIDTSERNGKLVAATLVEARDQVMLITTGGVLIRTGVEEIRETGRAAQGVRLINLDDGEKLAGLEKVVETEGEEGEDIEAGEAGETAGDASAEAAEE